jgi:hypothetical protein
VFNGPDVKPLQYVVCGDKTWFRTLIPLAFGAKFIFAVWQASLAVPMLTTNWPGGHVIVGVLIDVNMMKVIDIDRNVKISAKMNERRASEPSAFSVILLSFSYQASHDR